MQRKNSIYWISEFLPKIQVKIQDFAKKGISWIFNSIALNLIYTGSFIWGISFHNIKYLDKPIKCLEMRPKIKSVRKINDFFLCIFPYIWKSDICSIYLNFDKKCFFGYFKCQISKCSYLTSILPPVLAQGMQHEPSNKLILFISSRETPCRIKIEDTFKINCFHKMYIILSNNGLGVIDWYSLPHHPLFEFQIVQ